MMGLSTAGGEMKMVFKWYGHWFMQYFTYKANYNRDVISPNLPEWRPL